MEKTRKCCICKTQKNIEDFGKDRNKKDGLTSQCRKCRNENQKKSNKKYRRNNPEKVREACRKWRESNPEKAKKATTNWRERNPDNVQKWSRTSYSKNPEKSKEATTNWRNKNRRRFNENNRKNLKAQRDRMNDTYIKRTLYQGTSLKSADIPEALIEAKREQIKLKRLIKDMSN